MNFNFLKENKGFLIRIDDITDTMNWVMMNRCEKLFDDLKIKPLLGVIPLNKDLELSKIISSERNRQLNEFSIIHFKKTENKSYVKEF